MRSSDCHIKFQIKNSATTTRVHPVDLGAAEPCLRSPPVVWTFSPRAPRPVLTKVRRDLELQARLLRLPRRVITGLPGPLTITDLTLCPATRLAMLRETTTCQQSGPQFVYQLPSACFHPSAVAPTSHPKCWTSPFPGCWVWVPVNPSTDRPDRTSGTTAGQNRSYYTFRRNMKFILFKILPVLHGGCLN